MQQGPVQVTVIEYVNEFFKNYSKRAYGKTLLGNASKGAETLMGMLKLVLNRGGRDELRIALHCFKDQLTGAIHSPASVRQQQVDEVFALLSSLIDAAERLRQFSPVKEQLSTAVLEEVRFRLYRIVVGDGFCEDVDLRRRALDITFTAMMREAAEHERSRARINKLSCTGSTSAAAATAPTSTALVVAGHHNHAGAAAAAPAGLDAGGKGPGRLRGSFQRKAAALSGPDFSSWEGMWASLASMAPKRMLPLLQAVMTDLYLGKMMPGTPGAAATAAAAAAAGAVGSSNGNSSGCGTFGTPRSVSMSLKQAVQVPVQQQQQQQPDRVQSAPLQQTHSQDLLQQQQQQQQQGDLSSQQPHIEIQQQQQQPQVQSVLMPSGSSRDDASSCSSSPKCSAAREAGVQEDAGTAVLPQQQHEERCPAGPEAAAGPANASVSNVGQSVAQQHTEVPGRLQQQQQQQPSRFGRSSARPGHPIAAGYGASSGATAGAAAAVATPSTSSGSTPTAVATVTSINSSSSSAPAAASSGFNSTTTSSSPKLSGASAETRGAFAALASRFSGGGSSNDKAANADGVNSPGSGGSKWGNLAGGFLGLQSSSNGVVGSGRLIPRGWVQFGAHGGSNLQQQKGTGSGAAEELSAESPGTPAGADAYAAEESEAVVDARVQQQQQDQVPAAVEPCTPSKGASATAAAAGATGGVVSETGMRHDNAEGAGIESEHGFEQDEPDWGSGSSACCTLKAAASTAVHCTTAPASAAVGL